MPTEVDVTDCSGSKCYMDRSIEYKLSVKFVANQDSDDLKLDIKAKIMGIFFPWYNKPENICGKQIECPLKKGSQYTYQASFGDLSKYIKVAGIVYYRLNDINGDAQFCFALKFSLK